MKRFSTVQRKISEAGENPALKIQHRITDNSVQAELRLSETSTIRLAVDELHAPKNVAGTAKVAPWRLGGQHPELWSYWYTAQQEIDAVARIYTHRGGHAEKIGAKTKAGPVRRAAVAEAFALARGNALLSALPGKREIAKRRAEIADIQAWQGEILAMMRAHNGAIMAARRAVKQAQRDADAAALASGKFWDASEEAIKDHFSPPFAKNYLADVSEQWRAALFLECASVSYKKTHGGWGHKLAGTGRGYLCGIDDNDDEWGHVVEDLYQAVSEYGDADLDNDVEDAMAILFGTPIGLYDVRQGDLLFSPEKIPATVELYAQDEPWEVRESHTIQGQDLERNGRYFRCADKITVTHTSHAAVTLDPGEYRLYTLQIADAD